MKTIGAFSLILVVGLAGCGQNGPNMRVVSQAGGGAGVLVITSDDDSPFTVQRVVLNGREGENFCDLSGQDAPAKPSGGPPTGFLRRVLKRGDSTYVPFIAGPLGGCGSEITKADIYTDRGTKSIELADGKQGN